MSNEEFYDMVIIYSGIYEQELQNRIDACEKVDDEWNDYPYWNELKCLKDKQKDNLWKNVSKEIFTIFWQLEL